MPARLPGGRETAVVGGDVLPSSVRVMPGSEATTCSRRARSDGAALDRGGAPPSGTPHDPQPGRGRLGVALVDGASAVVGCAASTPLHVFTPRPRGRCVAAMLATHGGGIVAGDTVDLGVDVAAGAALSIATQAETKVYRSDGPWATQRVTARVADGAALAVVPEPTSCFAAARYRQEQRFELAPGASLLVTDAVTPGRSARDERWAFDAYVARLDVTLAGRLVLRDAIRLVRGEGVAIEVRMRGFEFLGTVVAIGPRLRPLAARVLSDVSGRAASTGDPVLVSASPLLDGVYLRVAARTLADGLAHLRATVALAADPFPDALRARS